MLNFHLKTLTHLISLICLALMLTFTLTLQQAQAQGPQNDQTVFLPLVIKGTGAPILYPHRSRSKALSLSSRSAGPPTLPSP